MKGISAILATVMLIVVVVALIGIFMSFSTSLLKSTQASVGNKTAEAIECSGASITIDEVFVTTSANTSTVRVVNNGLKNDLVIVSATLFNRTGSNFTNNDVPIPNFDIGEVEIIRFTNINVPNCPDFGEVIVTTNCGIAADTFTKAPKCT